MNAADRTVSDVDYGAGMTVMELRQYTLRPGQRDVLIELFDRELVEPQEALGMRLVGQFRDRYRPDRFVWVREYPDMVSRLESLTAFYMQGSVWKANAAAANATMIDVSDVLLLRPACPGSGFHLTDLVRPPVGATEPPESVVVATICHRAEGTPAGQLAEFFERRVVPVLAEAEVRPLAWYETEPAENTFPGLPVRTGEDVFVWFAAFPSADAYGERTELLTRNAAWTNEVLPDLRTRLSAPMEELVLLPTARSLLR